MQNKNAEELFKNVYFRMYKGDYYKFKKICKEKGLKMGFVFNKFLKEFIKENTF